MILKKNICEHKWQLVGISCYSKVYKKTYQCEKCNEIKNEEMEIRDDK